jgi:uncharacterized membrane protein
LFRLYYRRRLAQDLSRWIERGWIDPAHRDAILIDAAGTPATGGATPFLLAGLGVVLFAVGALLLLAANWQELPRVAKFATVLAALWGAYGAAFAAMRSASPRLAEALLLLGVLLFGLGILLVGQIYHLPADAPQGVLLWASGAMAAAWLWPSELAAILALLLAALWSTLTVDQAGWLVHWPFLPVWAVMTPVILYRRWYGAGHVGLLTLAWWIVLALGTLQADTDASAGDVLRLGIAVAAGFVQLPGLVPVRSAAMPFAMTAERYGLIGLVAGLSVLLIPRLYAGEAAMTDPLWPGVTAAVLVAALPGAIRSALYRRDALAAGAAGLAALVLAAALLPTERAWAAAAMLNVALVAGLIGLIVQGYRRDDRFLVNLGFVFFALTLMRLYADTFWLLFDRALFFLVGGVLVIGLGWALERRRRRLLDSLGRPA